MSQFLKNNWFNFSFLIIIITIISSAFYWYEIKPLRIEEECSGYASVFIEIGIKSGDVSGIFDVIYGVCMRNGGVENAQKIMKEAAQKWKTVD